MNIVVLCGGLSTERKISFLSGTKICKALRDKGHRAVLVDMFMGIENETEDVRKNPALLFDKLPKLQPVSFDGVAPDLDEVRSSRKLQSKSLFGEGVLEICEKADIVFIALHGMNGEDGRVQAAFDLLGIPYTGSGYLGAAIGMDKIITKEIVRPAGVNTPDWNSYTNVTEADIDRIIGENKLPCVVKTPDGGSTVGVYIVKNEADFKNALKDVLKYGNTVLVEQFIEGKEFTNAVFLNKALPCVEIAPKEGEYDYKNKYSAGATDEICPGRLSPELANKLGDIALSVHKILGLRTYSRSDFIIDKDNNIYFLEVNILPGMTPTSLVPQEAAADGISYEDLCEKIVEDGLKNCKI
ncbi:MAG: D-alanine--D-alanine ligase [Catonella sp.]|jgi:D-alanine-D-alanine ligase|nr:D-alanine--D-alanine ligase [Catonella sp.]MDY6357563.1 D-alanine--D-alanine ligase [Catonella sp.]